MTKQPEQRTPGEPSLSLVIPAYNEARRIESTVNSAVAYLSAQPYSWELIIVDDGSTDATGDLAAAALAGVPGGRVVAIPHAGKAAALRAGLQAATSDLIGFSDADLATPLEYLAELRAAIASGGDIAIGSREGTGARRYDEPWYRHVMGRGFNLIVRALLLPDIHDTQCGFKLFRRNAIHTLLDRSLLYRTPDAVRGPRVTAFDVELLVVGRTLGYRICQIPVSWRYGQQSKVDPARDTWHNLRDVLQVRLNLWRGRYSSGNAGQS